MLHRVVIAVCLQFLVSQSCECATQAMARIVGGTTTSITHIPYQIALYAHHQFTCGGSLITKNCVLTAGHCVTGLPASALQVRAGITLLSSTGGETRTVVHTFMPDRFNAKALEMDASILRLNAPLGGTNISTVELSKKLLHVGDQLQVSGWGFTSENASTVSNHLRVVTVHTISKAQCLKAYPGEITDVMFCAGAPEGGGKDSCSGDSGGPATKNGQQMGIVSWGKGCGRADSPGVYTSVKHILPWVNKVKLLFCGTK